MAGRGVGPGPPPPDQVTAGHAGADPLPARLLPPLAVATEWTLERTRSALRQLGDPHLECPAVHIAGTNGKGSVAAMCASVLETSGLRVGLYTSPHLCSYRERFRFGLEPVAEDALAQAAAAAYDAIAAAELTFFEASTVLAFQLFASRDVDVVVAEVGLGGRLDATNVVQPLVTAITNIGLDHTAWLGETLEEIALEKAGIAKPGVPLVCGERDPGVLEVIRAQADRVGATFRMAPSPSYEGARASLIGTPTDSGEASPTDRPPHAYVRVATHGWGDLRVRVPLAGGHQAANAALALAILDHLPRPSRPDEASLHAGMARVRWPGRVQIERLGTSTWIFDVAHNEPGANALSAAIEALSPPRPWIALLGLQADKDAVTMGARILPIMDAAILTEPPSVQPARRWDSEAAAGRLSRFTAVRAEPSLSRALARAAEAAGPGTVVVLGSHHTVGDALGLLELPPCGSGAKAP